jgi:Protein of unknown function (DUF3617)
VRRRWLHIVLAGCAWAAVLNGAQAGRKPGLWEVTSRTTWQQSPFAGATPAPDASPETAEPQTTTVCLTQEMIDKYGGPIPQTHDACQLSNVNRTANGMTADWVCNGRLNGKGSIQSSWKDDNHASGKVHFSGTMLMGQAGSRPVEWTNQFTSTWKKPDCDGVKPEGEKQAP